MTLHSLVIIGAGGFGREVADVVEAVASNGTEVEVQGFVDDAPSDEAVSQLTRRGYRLLGTVAEYLRTPAKTDYLIGIADPVSRRRIDAELMRWGRRAATAIHPNATIGSLVEIAEGAVICAGAVISTNVSLGRHAHVNSHATIGHDSRLGDYVTVLPGAVISGNCALEDDCSIGAGAILLQGLRVGSRAWLGAAALATRNVDSDTIAKGVPAR